jgi:ppGpp synthetase/RelA/SpoT-type nucleotidyltranferase
VSPLPISRSALDKLGERLAANEQISDDDYDLLLRVLTAYQAALNETQERLVALGYAPTTRTKTTSVLIEKLRRETGMKLKGVQDIAGARIVADCSRDEQDEIVRRIVAEFADSARPPKVKDRRAEPSAGYRAVHVVVTVQDLPVEIQVRTWRQDQWAQIVESLGDKWGRGLRYGAEPDDPDRVVIDGADMTRTDMWQGIQALSVMISALEGVEQAIGRLGAPLVVLASDESWDPEVLDPQVVADLRAQFAEQATQLRETLLMVGRMAANVH